MTQEQVQEKSQQIEIIDQIVHLDETVKTLYRRVEELVEVMDPVRVGEILTNVLIREKPDRADVYSEEEAGLNGQRSQLFDSFYNKYIDWKYSMFQRHHKARVISLRKKDVISTISKMDKPDGNSAVFNRFVWVALGREIMKEAREDKKNTQAEKENKAGVQLILSGQYEEALSHFDQAIQSSREFCMPLANKGIALGNLGRIREAVDCFRLVVATDPNFKIAWLNLALVYNKTGDFNYAYKAVRRALEIDPEYEAAQRLKEEILLKSKVLDGRRN